MGLVAEMSDQKPLSTDPHEGLAPVTPPADTGPKMSAAKPQLALGQTEIAFPDRPSPEVTREDNSLFGMPPEVAVLSGLAVGRAMGVAGLTAAGRAVAGLKAAAGQAAPVLKYEVVKHALQAAGISPALATAGAMAISAYKKGAPPAAEAEAIATGPHIDRSVPVQAGSLTAEQLAQRIKQPGSITEEARARFEAAKAARNGPIGVTAQPPAAEPITAPAPATPAAALPETVTAKPMLTAPETKEYFRLRMAGKSDAEAKTAIEAARAFIAAHGLTTPSAAETRFPKGMRGGVSQ